MRFLATLIGLAAFCALVVLDAASAQTIPLPRPRPPQAADTRPTIPSEPPPPSACRLRLTADLAAAPSLPDFVAMDECAIEDVVRLEAVMLPDKTRVAVMPPAIVRCTFAEAIVHWVRDGLAPAMRASGKGIKGIDNFASYECRGRNRIAGAKVSEHAKGNALDVRSIRLADARSFDLTDPHVPKELRETVRRSTCERFTTVLGPGSDGYHENHVHVDLIERRRGHRICQWDVREPSAESAAEPSPDLTSSIDRVPLPRPRPTPLPRPRPSAAAR